MAVIGRQDFSHRVSGAIMTGRDRARRAFSGRSGGRTLVSPRWAELALTVFLAVLLALITLRLFAPLPLPKGDVTTPAARQPAAAVVAVKNPFPASAVAGPVIEEAAPDVVDTTLDLTLTGVWANDETPSATIKTPDGKQHRFAVGEKIVNGARLESVYPDQVIINRGGSRESLRFERKAGGTVPKRPAIRASNGDPAKPAKTTSGGGGLGDFVRFAPATDENGKMVIDLYAGRDRQAFNSYGLRDGDRLISVNGAPPPNNPAELAAAMSAIQRESQAFITVMRDGKEIPVTLRLEQAGNQ